ncbi:MAG: TM2 domain-containing protein [Niabella sp.]|nr:TM2 domain-containing protein [Niabella sp.]
MDQQHILRIIPDIEYDELVTVLHITKDMNEQQQQQFLITYQRKRKSRNEMLLLTLIGFVGVAGIQRLVIGDIALGIIYLLTGGLCLVGTIIDLIKINSLTQEYNQKQALETAGLVAAIYNAANQRS